MSLLGALGLWVAAFLAGAVNVMAGGGSLISFPALLVAGYPSKVANVTNTVALWPGYLAGSFGYRSELRRQRRSLVALALPSVVGAVAGSAILLATPQALFDVIVPLLILFACLLLAAQDRLILWAASHGLGATEEDEPPRALYLATFLAAIYGAYFGAGLGILILACLCILLPDDIQNSNALKGMLSLIINAVALVAFALFGPVAWGPAVLMAAGAIAGGYSGVGMARRLGRIWLRRMVVAYGVVVATVLLIRLVS